MSEPDEMSQDGLTKLVALKVSIKIWSHIEAKGVGKRAAIEALGINSSDYLFQCPCCEYTYQQSYSDRAVLHCKEHCPAWLEFSAADNPRLGDDYPCERNPSSPYSKYPVHALNQQRKEHIYKQIGHDMVKLLKEAFERNLNESRLNRSMFD